jgi:protein-S-isoprenylcysteine O-methyltransferase Ste14
VLLQADGAKRIIHRGAATLPRVVAKRWMTMTAEQPHTPTNKPDVANLGLVRPPLVYLVALLVGVGVDLVRPARWLPAELRAWVGAPIMIAAVALFVSAIRRFKAASTPVAGNKPATAVVRSGPYRFTRNPIYLAFSLLVLGLACALDNLWLLGALAVAVSVMSFVVIPREESYLERRFGAEYLDYKTKVGRWI